jgi:hypothetical protein
MSVTLKNLLPLFLGVGLTGFWLAANSSEGEAAFPMPAGKLYGEECGGCHTAYAPGLLPARSWSRMMAELDNHFGEDASLAEPERQAILADLTRLAADGPQANLLMRRIAGGIPRHEAPQRISSTPFFKYMHDEVPAYIWKRAKIGSPANCGACHTKADAGRYYEREVVIPK